MMLQSCYAVFATSILDSVSFHFFLAHVELEKKLFAACNQVTRPCKEEAKQQLATWMKFLTRKKNALQNYTSPHICKTDRSRFLGYQQSLLLMALLIGYKTVEDAFDCDRHQVETFGFWVLVKIRLLSF